MIRLFALLLVFISGCSSAEKAPVPINPKFQELLIFFEDGNEVVVRECPNYFNITKRRSCNGIENRVDKELFYKEISTQITIGVQDYFKSYSQDEFLATQQDWKLKEKLDAERERQFKERFNQIKVFISLFQSEFDTATDPRQIEQALAHAEKDLRSGNRASEAINGINLYNRSLLKKVTVSDTFYPHGFSRSMYQFFLPVLQKFDPALNSTCGLKGDIEDRKRDCWRLKTAPDGTLWNLTSRFKDGSTLWLRQDETQIPQPIMHKHPTDKDMWVIRNCKNIFELSGLEECEGDVVAMVSSSDIKNLWYNEIGLTSWDFVIPSRVNERKAYDISAQLKESRKISRRKFNEIKVERLRGYINKFQQFRGLKSNANEMEVALRFSLTDLNHGRERSGNVALVNDFLSKTIQLSLSSYQIYPYAFDNNQNKFISDLLFELTPSAKPACGLNGDIDFRIKSCSKKKVVDAHEWNLVTRTLGGNEVWQDPATHILWGSQSHKKMGHLQAIDYCMDKSSLNERGNLSELTWELPAITDYRAADVHGVGTLFTDLNRVWNWTSTFKTTDKAIAVRFYQKDSRPSMTYSGLTSLHVRCVSKP
ncbi:MAG: hypothetical protein KA715_01530 [Xanthomonadaceae bacterium]|nr:hypothetical protein [Xanthomonadaceae bacterium]